MLPISNIKNELLGLLAACVAFGLLALVLVFEVVPAASLVLGNTTEVSGVMERKGMPDAGAGPAFYGAGSNEFTVRYRYTIADQIFTGKHVFPSVQSVQPSDAPWLRRVESGSNVQVCVSELFPSVSALRCGSDVNGKFWLLFGLDCSFAFCSFLALLRFLSVLKGK